MKVMSFKQTMQYAFDGFKTMIYALSIFSAEAQLKPDSQYFNKEIYRSTINEADPEDLSLNKHSWSLNPSEQINRILNTNSMQDFDKSDFELPDINWRRRRMVEYHAPTILLPIN